MKIETVLPAIMAPAAVVIVVATGGIVAKGNVKEEEIDNWVQWASNSTVLRWLK